MEKLVSRKGHLMELKKVKNPWKARCVGKSIFSDRFVCTNSEKLVLLTVLTLFLAENAFSTQDVEYE